MKFDIKMYLNDLPELKITMLCFHFSEHGLRQASTLQAVQCIHMDFVPNQMLYATPALFFLESAALR